MLDYDPAAERRTKLFLFLLFAALWTWAILEIHWKMEGSAPPVEAQEQVQEK